jgi:5-methyltetrahydrofolate--homocysteine methyltransferase
VPDEEYSLVREAVIKGKHKEIGGHVQTLLDKGLSAKQILDHGMLETMQAIGVKFGTGELFIPQVLLSARAMNEGLKVLEPHLAASKREISGKALVGTVRGDFHDIGKNMVVTMLRGVGFEVKDLGINLSPEAFVKGVQEYQPDIVGLSALLTTTMTEMRKVIQALAASGLRDRVKIIVGGAAVNEKFAHDIGADGYAGDAGEAVELAKRLMAS